MRLLIIGGSDAGISAALRARELSSTAHITVILADDYPNFSICGLPFYLSGETPDWKQLSHRTEFDGIEILRGHRATQIDAPNGFVLVRHQDKSKALSFDRLIVATGAKPVEPPIKGLQSPGVFPLHTMEHSFQIQQYIAQNNVKSALIIGAGYIGVEMADALTHRGLTVTLASRAATVLPSVEPELGRLVEQELRSQGVALWTGVEIKGIERRSGDLNISSSQAEERAADLVIIATGVQPDSALARQADIELGHHGAIRVNRSMETNIPGVFAAGDCVETWHRLLASCTYLPLGTTSHKQGRVAGENAVGGRALFAGSVGTQVVKVFGLAIARTGLLEREARDAGFDPFTVQTETWDHKAYYPGAKQLWLRVTGDQSSNRLLGAQIVGASTSEVAKRIDVFASALYHGMIVEALNELDLSYTPPLSSPWDPIQVAAQAWSRAVQTTQIQDQIREKTSV
ncbi:MAG TPA: FAD-dependent oxidoreductase [Bryobacteraceae bacterium]|jgi:NADPH-dependent 2,4-dienoyl-CoA reductase/sulfur reductase-like enzyme|nr:FAD-dependent oxidoreductase [Bryobacteraceae bacterium]